MVGWDRSNASVRSQTHASPPSPEATKELLSYDKLVIGTGALPVRPPITGLNQIGPAEGVHLLPSMGDTFAVMRTLEEAAPESAVIVGAGYIGPANGRRAHHSRPARHPDGAIA
ncbi:MAG TPA: FAD-dependent oxidoreductase [Streptosporangiaceae bacterium]|nr:FAD-dependent oxidoreductase [Streptosporangiaceae bacterium]